MCIRHERLNLSMCGMLNVEMCIFAAAAAASIEIKCYAFHIYYENFRRDLFALLWDNSFPYERSITHLPTYTLTGILKHK